MKTNSSQFWLFITCVLLSFNLFSQKNLQNSDSSNSDSTNWYSGNDTTNWYSGNDTTNWYSGNDTTNWYSGNDTTNWYSGNDTTNWYSGNDTTNWYSGNDTTNWYSGNDTLFVDSTSQENNNVYGSSAGLDEVFKINVDIYPNPFTDHITVSLNNDKVTEIVIRDIGGRNVFTNKYSENLINIDMNSLSSGQYTITIYSNSNVVTRNIVK